MKTKDPKKKFTKPTEGIKKASVKKAVTGKVAKTSEVKAKKAIRKSPIKAAPKTKKIEKKTSSIKAVAGKKTKAPTKKTAKQETSGLVQKSVKTSVKKKSVKTVQKPAAAKTSKPAKKTVKAITKAVPKKKAVTAKVKVKVKPKSVVAKVSAVKPKPAVKAEKKVPKKKAVTAKVKVKAKPESVVAKVSAVKPKPAVKAEKKVPKKKAVTAKVKVKAKPKSVVAKVPVVKPAPAVKAELKKVSKLTRTKAPKTVSKEKKAVAAKREPAVPVIPSSKSVSASKKYATREEPKPKAEPYPIKSAGARLKIFLPDQDLTKEEAEEIFLGGLPEEYGENSVIALAVDPNTVFVDWEVIPGDIADMEGDLNLRFYDITGIEFNDWNAHSVIDVPINKRVGNGFFDIRMPGRDVVVAVGILNSASGFMPIVRSDMVSFPELLTFDELGIVQNLFESGIPVGY